MTIDSHIHLWRAGDGYEVWIRRKIAGIDQDFTLDDYRRVSAIAGVTAAVLVHATEDPAETPHLLRLARDEPLVAAVIGWADLADPSMPHRLDAFQAISEKFRGLRVMPAFGAADALLHPVAVGNLRELARRGLVLDLLAAPAQLPLVPRLKDAVPDLPVILNHCGRPLTATGEVEPWAGALRAVARQTDVACKLSSLAERAGMDWDLARLQPYLDVVLQAFGPRRLAFGSNWPVVNIAASYAGWWQALEAMLARHALAEADRAAIFGGTARRFYGLPG
jgi:L-fuconolactonase